MLGVRGAVATRGDPLAGAEPALGLSIINKNKKKYRSGCIGAG